MVEDGNGKSESKTDKEPKELRFDVFEAFPFLLGKVGRGRIEVLVKVWVSHCCKRIAAQLLRSLVRGNKRLRPWWLPGGFGNELSEFAQW